MRFLASGLLGFFMVAAGCGGGDSGMNGVVCADTRCSAGQVCCIDCTGQGMCGAPGLACPGTGCSTADAAATGGDAAAGQMCGTVTCSAAQVCCLDCNGYGSCGNPGLICTSEACGTCSPPCGSGQLCCSEPSHMIDDAGHPGSYLTCAPPTSSGDCPKYP